MNKHSLLERQIRRIFGSDYVPSPDLADFFEQVDAAYRQFDHDRKLTEHVLEVSAQELTEVNSQLVAQNRRNESLLNRLRLTLNHFKEEMPWRKAWQHDPSGNPR